MNQPELYITVGLPGSGKTTFAKFWAEGDLATRARCNRDDIRNMISGRRLGTPTQEAMVTKIQDASIRALLNDGISVIADDTNLRWQSIGHFLALARKCRARFKIVNYLGVGLEECISRDAQRSGLVMLGDAVIRGMHERMIKDAATNWSGSIHSSLVLIADLAGHPSDSAGIDADAEIEQLSPRVREMAYQLFSDSLRPFE